MARALAGGRTLSAADQDSAYEEAVIAARRDPAMRGLVERAFLQEDASEALTAFCASEDLARVRRLLRKCGVQPGARVLDFGGGRGLLAAALALEGYRTTLCEPNPSAVCGTGAAAAVRAAAAQDFEIAPGDVARLAAESFDAVVCRAVLHHVDPLADVLRSVRRATTRGGAFVASDEPTVRRARDRAGARALHPFVRFGVEEDAHPVAHYVAALAEAGFVDVRARFPVGLGDYRRYVRPATAAPLATVLYGRYRLRGWLAPVPGQVRSFTARVP